MAGTYKIMIADDFPILREDLAEVIKEQPDMEVVGEASTGKEIVALAENMDYDLILMDKMCIRDRTRTQLQTELLETWEKERKTCFFITHDVDEAIILAQKVIIMSARPGRIKEIVDINIPYPRTQETKMTPEFLELKNHIWSQVYQEYLEVRK